MNGLRPAPGNNIANELLAGALAPETGPLNGFRGDSDESAGFLGTLQDQVERELLEGAGAEGALLAASVSVQAPSLPESPVQAAPIEASSAQASPFPASSIPFPPRTPASLPGLEQGASSDVPSKELRAATPPESPTSTGKFKEINGLQDGSGRPQVPDAPLAPGVAPQTAPEMAMVDWRSALPENAEADLEEITLDAKAVKSAKSKTDPAEQKKSAALPVRASTEDFLSLRAILPKKSGREEPKSDGAETAPSFAPALRLATGPQVEAPVMKSPSGSPMIAKDALEQISQQVNLLGQARKDGEIKIRLRPDHLGELMMSVKTNGRTVSLEIKAQDPEAKKIIEESIESLRDSLSQKSLDLAKVDIVAQPQRGGESDFGTRSDFGSGQGGFQQNSGAQEQGFSGRDRQEFPLDAPVASGSLKSAAIGARSGRSNGAGTLDLIA